MYKLKGSIWIDGRNGTFIGAGRILLLERIRKFGSITLAAKSMKMSYRHAWELVNSMNRESKRPLVETTTGGNGGGGTVVTREGNKMIRTFRRLNATFEKFRRNESARMKL